MNSTKIKTLFAFLIFLACLSCSSIPKDPRLINSKEVDFEFPKPIIWSLDNGLKIYFIENFELPKVSAKIYLPGGNLYELPNNRGASSALGSLLREGGTNKLKPEELDYFLEERGARIESSYDASMGNVFVSCLKEDLNDVFPVFADVIQRPGFDENRFELWKTKVFNSIKERGDNPDVLASIAFSKIVFPKDDPNSLVATSKTIENLSLEYLKKLYSDFVRPDGSRLVITGALSKKEAEELVNKYFSRWETGEKQLSPLKDLAVSLEDNYRRPGIYVLKKDFSQARILIGNASFPRHNPDTFNLIVFNEIFGLGGFSSKLFSEIRTKLGLAYTVYGGVFPGVPRGVFKIYAGTRNEQAISAIKNIIKLTDDARKNVPTEKEMQHANEAIKNSFIFKFESKSSLVSEIAYLEHLGYPPLYNDSYLAKIKEVSAQSARDAFKRSVNTADLSIIVVGNVDVEQIKNEFLGKYNVYELDFNGEEISIH